VQLPWTVSADFAERHRFSQKQAAKLAAVISRHANKNGSGGKPSLECAKESGHCTADASCYCPEGMALPPPRDSRP
jgi:hypothetical protein